MNFLTKAQFAIGFTALLALYVLNTASTTIAQGYAALEASLDDLSEYYMTHKPSEAEYNELSLLQEVVA